ncbi:hypothetical protein HRS9139_05934 [Pyrenophora teres f. teres]|nr:hypothetical protein HRS9139_05934 [Pyrenophora teres f. teres]
MTHGRFGIRPAGAGGVWDRPEGIACLAAAGASLVNMPEFEHFRKPVACIDYGRKYAKTVGRTFWRSRAWRLQVSRQGRGEEAHAMDMYTARFMWRPWGITGNRRGCLVRKRESVLRASIFFFLRQTCPEVTVVITIWLGRRKVTDKATELSTTSSVPALAAVPHVSRYQATVTSLDPASPLFISPHDG